MQSVARGGRADYISDCKLSLDLVPLVFVRFYTDLNIFLTRFSTPPLPSMKFNENSSGGS